MNDTADVYETFAIGFIGIVGGAGLGWVVGGAGTAIGGWGGAWGIQRAAASDLE